eukprot:213598-Hanusia_phi.AAC.6
METVRRGEEGRRRGEERGEEEEGRRGGKETRRGEGRGGGGQETRRGGQESRRGGQETRESRTAGSACHRSAGLLAVGYFIAQMRKSACGGLGRAEPVSCGSVMQAIGAGGLPRRRMAMIHTSDM